MASVQSGGVYVIVSVVDESVVDVAESDVLPGAKLVAYGDAHQGDNQKFQFVRTGSTYTISSVLQMQLEEEGEEEMLRNVWDYNQTTGTLEQHPYHGGPNQQFVPTEVSPGIVRISCAENNFCVQHNGEGNPLTLAEEDPTAVNQQWRLQQVQ